MKLMSVCFVLHCHRLIRMSECSICLLDLNELFVHSLLCRAVLKPKRVSSAQRHRSILLLLNSLLSPSTMPSRRNRTTSSSRSRSPRREQRYPGSSRLPRMQAPTTTIPPHTAVASNNTSNQPLQQGHGQQQQQQLQPPPMQAFNPLQFQQPYAPHMGWPYQQQQPPPTTMGPGGFSAPTSANASWSTTRGNANILSAYVSTATWHCGPYTSAISSSRSTNEASNNS